MMLVKKLRALIWKSGKTGKSGKDFGKGTEKR